MSRKKLLILPGQFYICVSLLFSFQGDYVFYVVGVWEHVHRTYRCDFIVAAEDLEVTSL
jgi:hypothetical protein